MGMNEDEVINLFLQKVQGGMSFPEAARALVIEGVDKSMVDSILSRFEAIEHQDQVGHEAERQLADLEMRYAHWKKFKHSARKQWGSFTGAKMGPIGRSMSLMASTPEAASEIALSFAMGFTIIAVSTYWLFIVRPSQPHQVNAPPHPMDCTLLSSGAIPDNCH